MKKIMAGLGAIAIMMVIASSATAEIPETINLQSVVYDQDGNVTDADFVGVSVQIVDETGNVYFQEDHYDVPVVQGAMNLIIGESSGGIPPEALDPTKGRKFVDILVDGSNPYDILPLSSVPYAFWADTAVGVVDGSIDGDSIKEGSIELRHLAQGFSINEIGGTVTDAQIPTNIVRQETFDLHVNSSTAHQAGSIVMNPNGAYAAQLGGTVQIALETLYNNYAQEVANRQTAVTNLQNQISSNDSDISSLTAKVNSNTSRIGSLEGNMSSAMSTLSNHETRISNIENGADSREEALGWGVVNSAGSTVYGFNVGGSSTSGNDYNVSFSSPAANNNVVVMLTAGGNYYMMVSAVSMNGFTAKCYRPNTTSGYSQVACNGGFHWLAFGS